MALVPQGVKEAFHRLLIKEAISADMMAVDAWLLDMPTEVAAVAVSAGPRASVAQTADYTLAAADKGAVDEAAGPLVVNVPAAATLGDPWSYRLYVASGGATVTGAQATVPISSGATAFLSVANGKVYCTMGTTTTRVA